MENSLDSEPGVGRKEKLLFHKIFLEKKVTFTGKCKKSDFEFSDFFYKCN